MKSNYLIVILILIGVIVLLWWIARKFKLLNLPCVYFVSGAVKSGKSLLAVHMAIKEYKKNLRNYYIKKWFVKIFLPFRYKTTYGLFDRYKANNYQIEGLEDMEGYKEYCPPMLYSNIPLACIRFNKLSIEQVERNLLRTYP